MTVIATGATLDPGPSGAGVLSMTGATRPAGFAARRVMLGNRFHARLTVLSRAEARLVAPPDPWLIGSPARGKQIVGGELALAGHHVDCSRRGPFTRPLRDPVAEEALHGFGWLDDLAALGGPLARDRAQDWTRDWVARFGGGRGPGWAPAVTGRRVLRWISHAGLIGTVPGLDRVLMRQATFLSRRWHVAERGLPRFEAASGLLHAALALEGAEDHIGPAASALATECDAWIGADGAIPTRNPEELLDIFVLLAWGATAMRQAGHAPAPAHDEAIARAEPALRVLRHADGGLGRFHGGGRGTPHRLDQALAATGSRPGPCGGFAMGYARLAGGRTTVIVDAAAPPEGAASSRGHASTLAFEMTSARRAVIVNCGSGLEFGGDWRRAGRATPSHSTLGIDGYSSSRLGAAGPQADLLLDRPQQVTVASDAPGALLLSHNGWRATHGLIHVRELVLQPDGRALSGEDALGTITERDRATHTAFLQQADLQGVRFSIRFHLHPDVDAVIDDGGTAVTLRLRSGEAWMFRHDGTGVMALQPSIYLDKQRLRPRGTKQIVLSATVADYAAQIGWTLAKAQDTPLHIRDLEPDDPLTDV